MSLLGAEPLNPVQSSSLAGSFAFCCACVYYEVRRVNRQGILKGLAQRDQWLIMRNKMSIRGTRDPIAHQDLGFHQEKTRRGRLEQKGRGQEA